MSGFILDLVSFNSEECFDIDFALTTAVDEEEEEEEHYFVAAPADPSLLVFDMPTVLCVGTCSVCIEEFVGDGKDAKQMPCGHIYHSTCISSWLSRHNSCPLCRSPLALP
ncbi:hypothetical protein GIB67_032899 [Kingdonia uniflora]|uniref:RING-type domain-containing protein n=1 Tax=Kingdonia uniflora TaxID=39325 RepID=A0A7J7MZ77_9MAGN|nr:hypothetical protein GIB67_032899 [Kingdonia uniflora]